MSSSDQTNASSSSSQPVRDLAFLITLTFVLEPKQKSVAPSSKALQSIASQLGVNTTPTKDPRSKNYWVQANHKTQATKIRSLLKSQTDFGEFIVREIRPDSPEETRIRRHITGQLGLTAVPPSTCPKPDPDTVGASTPNNSTDQEASTSKSADRRQSQHPTDQCQPTPSQTQPTNEKALPVHGKKRNADRAFSDADEAPEASPEVSGPPEASVADRPRKHVKFNLHLNTYKYFNARDILEPLPGSSSALANARKPPTINELPSACLQSIFIYGTPNPVTTPPKTYRTALYNLMLVCSKWKTAAETTPTLWSYLSNAIPPGMVEAWIQRSSSATIIVKFDGSMEYPSKVQSALERFVDKVAPHRLRWRSAWFSDLPPTQDSYSAVARAFNGPAPALISAKVTTIHGTTMPFVHTLRFFGGRAPALRHITLTGIVPELSDVPIFTTIESLRVIRPMGISPAYILCMLARNDKLRSLELVEVRPSYARLFQNIETLELPELLHFKLHLLGENTVEMAQLFTRLRAPKCRRLELAIDMDHLKNLKLAFNMLEFGMEAFLVYLGSWMSHWMVLNRASSADAWVDSTEGGGSHKSAFCWQYGGAIHGSYRGLSANVRLEVDNHRTRQIILGWAEDVKAHAELVEAGVRRRVRSGDIESFPSYRARLIKDREGDHPEDHFRPHEFMGIWDIGSQATGY